MTPFKPLQDILRGIGILLLILVIGTIGYHFVEGWSFFDSLFMTVTTITTVGYREIHPLSLSGQIFTMVLILGGVGTALYVLTTLVMHILEGELGIRMGRRRMEAKIKRLRNHVIICGYGRVGEAIAKTLSQQGVELVAIDRNESSINRARQAGHLAIFDDATMDDVLKQARIETARGLITALGNDADNVYTTLAAHELNPALPIIARASNEDAKKKLQQAGAHRVMSPETIVGERMALLALRPEVVESIETVLFSRDQQLLVEEIETGENSTLIGATIKEIEDRFPGVVILALRKHDGSLTTRPKAGATVPAMSRLVAFGTSEQLYSIEGCCQLGTVRT
jgi:voltage-gated potassium channel